MIDKKKFALNYYDNGFIPIPLCWVKDGRCGCFMNHTEPKLIGKSPLVQYKNLTITREMVEEWFARYPEANIGILIRESGLVIVDADSAEAITEFERVWANASMIPTVTTGRGKHYYFKAKPSTPSYRGIHKGKSGKLDVFSNGYIVAPPSVHMTGNKYFWSNPPKKTGLPNVPYWIEKFLSAESNKRSGEEAQLDSVKVEVSTEVGGVILADLPLNNFIKDIIRLGEHSPYYKQRGYKTRSEALHGMIISCYEKRLTDDEVFSIFSNPRYAMSYKYLENKSSKTWLEKEMKRAKVKIETKKIAVFPQTTTPNVFNSIQTNEIKLKGQLN